MRTRRNRIDYGVLTGRMTFGVAVENIIMDKIMDNSPKECEFKAVNLMSKHVFNNGELCLIQTSVAVN